MHSRLFALREQHGIFYSISASTVAGAGKQPGMVLITAMTTPDHLAQAKELIGNAINTVVDTLTEEELHIAKQVILNDPADWYSTNSSIASTYLWLQRYGFPFDYVAQRAEYIKGITLAEVKAAARRWLRADALTIVQVGRVEGALAIREPQLEIGA
jgi:zinc protease